MKEKIRKEYTRRARKLNGVNTFSAMESRVVAVIKYSAGVVHWRKEELQGIDRKTRKLLSIYGIYHPQSDKDRLYVKRKKGRRGLISLEDAVDIEINSLRTYVDKSEEQLLSKVRREGIIEQGNEKNEIQMEHENAYRNKALHGRYFVATDNVRGSKSWEWLRRSLLKKETEGMIMAAQEQTLRTRNIRKVIDKEKISGMCRMCGEREETAAHIVSECNNLAQNEYKNWRHDKVATIMH